MSALDPSLRDKYLVDPYDNWATTQGVPVVTAPAVQLTAVPTQLWPRYGVDGAIAHLEGRCDFLTLFIFDIAAHASATPLRHVYEELVYVVSGSGETDVALWNGVERRITWRAGHMFSMPVNARHEHRAGAEGARLAVFSDIRYLLGLYRNESFLFDNPATFEKRHRKAAGEPWLEAFTRLSPSSGDDGARGELRLADSALGASVMELADGQSTLARRQMQGAHLLCVAGQGASLSFDDPNGPVSRTPWSTGDVIGLTGMRFHQHVAHGGPARFAVIELGSMASPMFRSRRAAYGDETVYASGAATIARADQSDAMKSAQAAPSK